MRVTSQGRTWTLQKLSADFDLASVATGVTVLWPFHPKNRMSAKPRLGAKRGAGAGLFGTLGAIRESKESGKPRPAPPSSPRSPPSSRSPPYPALTDRQPGYRPSD